MSSDNYNEYIDKGIHLFRKGVKEAKKLGKKANKEIKKAAGLPTGPCTETNPRYYIVVARQGAMVRKGIEMDSPQVHGLRRADICTVVKISGRRARIVEPVEGWVSLYTADGEVIMRQTLPPDRREQNMHLDRRFEQVKREQDRVGGYKEAVKIANDHATAAMGEGGDGSGGSAAAAERYYQKESNAGGTAADFGYANRRDSAQEDSAVATAASLSTVAVRAKPETKNNGNGSGSAIPKLAAPGTLPKLPPPPSRRSQQHHDVAQGPSIITTTQQQQQQQQGSMDLLGFDDEEEEQQPARTTDDRTVSQPTSSSWGFDPLGHHPASSSPGPSSGPSPALDIFSSSTSIPQQQGSAPQLKVGDSTNPFAALQGLGFPSSSVAQASSSSTTQSYHQPVDSNQQQQQQMVVLMDIVCELNSFSLLQRSSSLPPPGAPKAGSSSSSSNYKSSADPFADLI
ncbi:hypothetical protein FOZ60_009914 [Perkinsus olseni]|uniref:Uncharacterized protein n=1 Tax=Perkinsus olseni TaxID=32597 RepID=A0A7J6PNW5_PEROL|nr:hypothetical protein FOZ60_009914 [Perkinsus olseni]